MKLRETIRREVKSNQRLKARLALVFGKSVFTIERWISENEANGDLTKAAALDIIREELDLTDGEILETEVKAA